MSNQVLEIINSSPIIEAEVSSTTAEIFAEITTSCKDGRKLEFKWEGTSLGVRAEGEQEYQFVDLQAQSYVHDQILAKKEWVIEHNLGRYPSVFVIDSGRSVVIGDTEYVNDNTLVIRFTAEFSGKAYLN